MAATPANDPLATAETFVDARGEGGRGASPAARTTDRTTVLPRIDGDGARVRLIQESKLRYEPLKLLGAGGMGEVMLVHDQDIARKVAVKRLLPDLGDPAVLARFVDEIRTVGRLEHPNIVPIHDVGVDEQGRYFFVMKYVEGETLAEIIDKLAAGDRDYHERYTFELRVEIFLDVLQALAYAHANGVVHRDIKPANVMVGRYGEVVLMDWGVARPIDAERDLAARAADATLASAPSESRMFATRVGALVGTPAYMAPEQARGDNDKVDARSDLYSACALFYELLCLRHYLPEKTSMGALIAAVIGEEVTYRGLRASPSPHQPKVPMELLRFCYHGLQKDPDERHASAKCMIKALQRILEGRLDVRCAATLQKRALREAARVVDKRPRLTLLVFMGLFAALIWSGIELVRRAIT
ncbi:MAG TPA: serine/threonine-protein kinase [Polyangiaceae bacterium]|jgi:serine/threonine-protein kinase|nr:serine/threonine-protein kinase [Polyangiaceae bacterium]